MQSGPGIPERDKNARPAIDQLIKYSRYRAFLAPFKERELRSLGHRNSPAIYLEELAFLTGIKMRGQLSINSLNTVGTAHFWPHLRRENCEALNGKALVLTFSFKVDTFRVRFRNEISLDIKES